MEYTGSAFKDTITIEPNTMTEIPMYLEYAAGSQKYMTRDTDGNFFVKLQADRRYLITVSAYLTSNKSTSVEKVSRGLFLRAYINNTTSYDDAIEIGSYIEYSYGAKENTYSGSVSIPLFLYDTSDNYNSLRLKLFARINTGGKLYPNNAMTQMVIIPLPN